MSAHSYSFKHYHGLCFESYTQTEVHMELDGDNTLYPVWPGARHRDSILMDAGSTIDVLIYSKFGEVDLLPHDWSVTAWSEISPVSIEHTDGYSSGSFRNLEADSSIPVPAVFNKPAVIDDEDEEDEEDTTMIVRDYSLDNDHFYNFQVSLIEFGTFTERIRAGHKSLNQTLTFDLNDGRSYELDLGI